MLTFFILKKKNYYIYNIYFHFNGSAMTDISPSLHPHIKNFLSLE